MGELEIYTKHDAISVEKANKTCVDYFIFDEFEIHLNKIPPATIQEWHKHSKIEEVITVVSGEITVKWFENEKEFSKTAAKGTVIRVKKSIHTIENKSSDFAEFIVYRMVPSGTSKREIIKNDKTIIPINNLPS